MTGMSDLRGKRAIITGGARGIGFACASALAGEGAAIVLVDIHQDELDEAVKKMKAYGVKVDSFLCDVSSLDSVELLYQYLKASGGIDIFIHSAAVTIRKLLLEMSVEEWDWVINTNLRGAFLLGRKVGALLKEQGRGGKMIYIVSTGAFRASEMYGSYGASKAGVVMLMKTLALELAPFGITCNAIAPTATDTKFTSDFYAQNPEKKVAVIKNHPLGRIAVPEDYMGTALYLASSASDFVTGSLIVVDGGKTAK